MVEDRLSISLMNAGYHRIDSNAQGIYLFYRVGENELEIVSVIHAPTGNEYTVEQYHHILDQIKANFSATYPNRLHLLSLIFTMEPGQAKHLCADATQDSHWIIDMSSNRLMIYETQSNDFYPLQGLIEQLLIQEQNPQEQYPQQQSPYNGYDNRQSMQGRQSWKLINRVMITPFNSSIILLNILIFLITQYTPLFGGKDVSVENGALSWYYVREGREYYRILTSMFLHSGWSHLVNNMIVLLFVGSNLERAAGKIRYLFIYFGAGIIAGITSISYNMWKEYDKVPLQDMTISIGASGAIFGVVGAILFIVIINKGRLQEISLSQMILFVVLTLYSGIVNAHIDQAAHIGGFMAGLLLAIILYRRPERAKNT